VNLNNSLKQDAMASTALRARQTACSVVRMSSAPVRRIVVRRLARFRVSSA
jgi:hypothetical protein